MVHEKDAEARRYGVENQYAWMVPHVLRGCLAMVAAASDPDDLAWLLPMAERAIARENVGLFNRVARTMGLIGTQTTVRSLALMRRRCRHSTMRGQLEAALGEAASASSLTIAEAEEFSALAADAQVDGPAGRGTLQHRDRAEALQQQHDPARHQSLG